MFVVQPCCGGCCDEELAPISLGPGIGHADRVRSIMPERRMKLVLERTTPQTLSPRTIS
jgi:hypothetical protein